MLKIDTTSLRWLLRTSVNEYARPASGGVATWAVVTIPLVSQRRRKYPSLAISTRLALRNGTATTRRPRDVTMNGTLFYSELV